MNRKEFYTILKKQHDEFRMTTQWKLFRQYIVSSRHATCEFCGKQYKKTSFLDVHHKFFTNYTNLDETRFMLLCKECHKFLHKKSGTPLLGQYTNLRD